MMAFKTINVSRESGAYNGDRLEFQYKVNINQDGLFTAYLPEDVVEKIQESGIALKINPHRRSRAGFFSSDTMRGLQMQVKKILDEYFSRELTEEKEVIRYVVQTTCSYCLDIHGNIVPNGNPDWVLSKNYDWKEGSIEQNAANSHPYGVLVYARVFRKKTYTYRSGKQHIEYQEQYTNGMEKEDAPYKYHLSSFCSMRVPTGRFGDGSNMKELDYTEAAAKFFADLLTSICKLNERIKDHLDPKSILKLIETHQKLLT